MFNHFILNNKFFSATNCFHQTTQNVEKSNSNCDRTQKLKILTKLKTQSKKIMAKAKKNLNWDKTQE